jgi:hypothetical protein
MNIHGARMDSIAVPAQGKTPKTKAHRRDACATGGKKAGAAVRGLGFAPGEVRRGAEALRSPSLHQRHVGETFNTSSRMDSIAVPAQGKTPKTKAHRRDACATGGKKAGARVQGLDGRSVRPWR